MKQRARRKHPRPYPRSHLVRQLNTLVDEIQTAKRRLIWEFCADVEAKKHKLMEKSLMEVVEVAIRDHVHHHRQVEMLSEDLSEILGLAVMRLSGKRVELAPVKS